MVVVNVYPISSDTSVQQWSNSVSPSQTNANHYLNFDEIVADDATSYVQCAGTTPSYEHSKFNDAGLTTETINSVTIYFRCFHVVASSSSAFAVPMVNKTYTGTVKSIPAAWTTNSQTFTTNPVTGNPWQVSELTSYWFGTKGYMGDSKGQCRLTQMYLAIDYVPLAAITIEMQGVELQGVELL